ncbi:hypothetical protein EV426DRAFT_661804 [Tirmania nivea]|nr:hypothetical protein EV426DRAFT_661804 [Tirmania nivea]
MCFKMLGTSYVIFKSFPYRLLPDPIAYERLCSQTTYRHIQAGEQPSPPNATRHAAKPISSNQSRPSVTTLGTNPIRTPINSSKLEVPPPAQPMDTDADEHIIPMQPSPSPAPESTTQPASPSLPEKRQAAYQQVHIPPNALSRREAPLPASPKPAPPMPPAPPTRAQAVVMHGPPTRYKPGQMRRWIEDGNKE